jgi:hypothetical protein
MTLSGANVKMADARCFKGKRSNRRLSPEAIKRRNDAAKKFREKYPLPRGGNHPMPPRLKEAVEIHENADVEFADETTENMTDEIITGLTADEVKAALKGVKQ